MSNNSPSQICKKCGKPRVHQGKFCVICGTRFIVPDAASAPVETAETTETNETSKTEDSEDLTTPTVTEDSEQDETAPLQRTSLIRFDQGITLVKALRKNLSIVLIGIGAISIIGAIAFTLLMLLPKEIIAGLEVPPLEGMIFDLFVLFGLLAILIKEAAVLLGYLPKRGTLDRWFSFVLLLVYWVNLITFSLGLVEESIFIDLGVSFALIFIILSIHTLIPSFIYFKRFKENTFSGILSIILVSVLYLFQWITPIDPTLYTITVIITVTIVLLIVLQSKDIFPFIGLEFLLPLIFLSPYLLSNSVVILVLLVINSFPFIEILLRNYMNQESDSSNSMQTIGQLISPLGIITTCFALFYGYLEVNISLILFAIPVLGFIGLKEVKPIFQRSQAANLVIIIYLLFTTIFLDLSINNNPVLIGLSILLTIQAIVVVFENIQTDHEKFRSNYAFLLLMSLIAISLTKIDFIWKILIIFIPIVFLLYLLTRKVSVSHSEVQLIVFGVEIVFLLSFLRTPFVDWIIIPISLVLALICLSTIVIFHRTKQVEKYSLDISIFTIIFEIILLVVMFWTQSSTEMLYPVMILIVFAGILLLVEVQRRVTNEFQWINASFLVCFGVMTFWNEFDEIILLITTFLLILPIVIDLLQTKDMEKSSLANKSSKIFNLNLSLSGIGLSLIIFFEEFSPLFHGLIYLIVIITWLGMYFSARNSLGNLSVLTILILPGIIFCFELLLHETIFTPITENSYLFLTIPILILPAILLQIDKSILRKETAKIIIAPLALGTAVVTLLTAVAFLIYGFDQQESAILIIGLSIGIIVSTFFIEWQYESGLLLLISSIPPLFYLIYLETISYMFYLLPLLPIIVNFFIGFQYSKTNLGLRLNELIIVSYLILFVLFNPLQMIVYSTALVSVFLFSWQILGIIKQKHHKATFILTNTINSGFVLGLALLLNPLPLDLYIFEIPISFISVMVYLIIVLITLSTLLHLLYWQFREIDRNFSFLILTLIFDCSAVIIALIALLTRYTDLVLGDILIIILLSTIVLVMLFILVYTKEFLIKSQISTACIYVTTIWLILSSTHSPNVEIIFLWLFFAPILMIVYLTKKDKNIGFLGLFFYVIAGMRLFTHTIDFILLGDTEWLTILGLIVYGIEMVTLGIYTSLTKKSPQG